MKFLLPLAVVLFVYWFFVAVLGASAYTTYGTKWTHPVTYDGNAQVGQALKLWSSVSGVKLGGISATPDIVVMHPSPWPFGATVAGAAVVSWNGTGITACVIYLPGGENDITVLHEVGHCLGIGHSDVFDAVMFPSCCHGVNTFHPDDIAAIQFLYGKNSPVVAPVYRYWFPMLIRS